MWAHLGGLIGGVVVTLAYFADAVCTVMRRPVALRLTPGWSPGGLPGRAHDILRLDRLVGCRSVRDSLDGCGRNPVNHRIHGGRRRLKYAASSILSNPMTCTPPGTAMPLEASVIRAPIASWSLNATIPANGMPVSMRCCAIRAPEPIDQSLPVSPIECGSSDSPRSAHSSRPRRATATGRCLQPLPMPAPDHGPVAGADCGSWRAVVNQESGGLRQPASSVVTWSALPWVERAPRRSGDIPRQGRLRSGRQLRNGQDHTIRDCGVEVGEQSAPRLQGLRRTWS